MAIVVTTCSGREFHTLTTCWEKKCRRRRRCCSCREARARVSLTGQRRRKRKRKPGSHLGLLFSHLGVRTHKRAPFPGPFNKRAIRGATVPSQRPNCALCGAEQGTRLLGFHRRVKTVELRLLLPRRAARIAPWGAEDPGKGIPDGACSVLVQPQVKGQKEAPSLFVCALGRGRNRSQAALQV